MSDENDKFWAWILRCDTDMDIGREPCCEFWTTTESSALSYKQDAEDYWQIEDDEDMPEITITREQVSRDQINDIDEFEGLTAEEAGFLPIEKVQP